VKTHRFASHTPGESRRLSNLGHIVEGILLGAVGGLALLGNLGLASWASTAWPILILVAGVLLLVLIYPRHPLADWPAIWRDPQQRQHTIMAVAIAVAGAAELLRANSPLWAYVWPGVILLIGVMFLTHRQHGTGEAVTKAVWQHRLLGITAVVAGLLRFAEVLTAAKIWSILWPLVLLAAAAQLVLYREPEGAYEVGADHGEHG
jgi:cell wall-active antibiotic response 4TMS protein YvqF